MDLYELELRAKYHNLHYRYMWLARDAMRKNNVDSTVIFLRMAYNSGIRGGLKIS